VHNHGLKFNKVWTYIRASKAQEKRKVLVEDLKKNVKQKSTC